MSMESSSFKTIILQNKYLKSKRIRNLYFHMANIGNKIFPQYQYAITSLLNI